MLQINFEEIRNEKSHKAEVEKTMIEICSEKIQFLGKPRCEVMQWAISEYPYELY